MGETERADRPGDRPGYRVGRHCPWNIYRIHPDSEDRDKDYRFAVAIGPNSPADGPLIVQALNGWQSMDSDLRSPLAEARSTLERSQASLKLIAGRYKEEIDWRLKAEQERDRANAKAAEYCRLYQSTTDEAGEPPAPRVWEKWALEPDPDDRPLVVRDRMGDEWGRVREGWMLIKVDGEVPGEDANDVGPHQWLTVCAYAPLTEVLPGVPSGGDPDGRA